MNAETKAPGITGFTLKMIAISTMLVDHVAAGIGERIIYYDRERFPFVGEHIETFETIYEIMRIIGRMAFPIFCFLLVEGFIHTRSRLKYARNLLVFALISEIPFDLAFNYTYLEFESNNVFFTLFLGLLMMIVLEAISKKRKTDDPRPIKRYFRYFIKATGYAAVILVTMVISDFLLFPDYGASGIAAITAMYILRRHRLWGFGLGVALLGLMAGSIEFYAMLMLIPVYFYNGKRGPQNGLIKFVFYWFYPVHLFLIAVFCKYVGLPVIFH